MPLRVRDTATLAIKRVGPDESGETDRYGNPREGWTDLFNLSVESFEPSNLSAGGTERTRAGVVVDADVVAITGDERAAAIEAGEDHAVLTPAGVDPSGPQEDERDPRRAYVVERVRTLSGRYRTASEWELHLLRDPAGTPADYE